MAVVSVHLSPPQAGEGGGGGRTGRKRAPDDACLCSPSLPSSLVALHSYPRIDLP